MSLAGHAGCIIDEGIGKCACIVGQVETVEVEEGKGIVAGHLMCGEA
ncbi:Uncharacterised protein [Mycobacterium tuberculosis]|nr:Uncharacterised protein [Mycobacterium tuberculosis]